MLLITEPSVHPALVELLMILTSLVVPENSDVAKLTWAYEITLKINLINDFSKKFSHLLIQHLLSSLCAGDTEGYGNGKTNAPK